ncbi:T9SS type A sorting domain-containing protein [Bacteroides salyersiae]|jgi:hypothetical protein|uniref:T9SS type A sorting domain-containing protein n=1 Tax=Bacteroides salyersiae TaxID=291644 RepID=UPI001C8B310C|nr:T9SS type A sorting domain-containing protein [Bacteroides salyersiae]
MKRFYYSAAALFLSAFVATTQAQVTLADFEEPELDMLDMTGYNNDANGSLTVVANPSTDGINTSTQCLLNNRKLVDWSNSIGKLYSSALDYVEVNDEKRYLHVMVYSEETAGALLYVRTGELDDTFTYDQIEMRFDFTAGEWKDVVVDLSGKASAVYGLYFLSQDWSAPEHERNFYYDEIILNDDPLPRGATYIVTEGVAADFENEGVTLTYENTGDACAFLNVVENEDNTGVNSSAYALLIETTTQDNAAWWGGANLFFERSFMVTEKNRYFHALVKTDLESMEFNFFADGEQWGGSFAPQKDVWYDVVVDLANTNEHNLTGKLLTGFRALVYANEEVNRGKKLYLDEIVLNDNPMPRVALPTGLADQETNQAYAYAIESGIAVKNASGEVTVCDVTGKNFYKSICNGDMTLDLPQGIYIVSLGDKKQKVMVK